MGSTSSKAARKLSKDTSLQWVGSHVSAAEPARPRPGAPLAAERKNEAIERDTKDPHFMDNLSQLGQVRVDHRMQTIRAASDVQNMYHSRARSEVEASALESTQNRLLASSLADLLEARKSITDRAGLEALGKRYHVDAATLQQLGRVVNTPSIDESTVVRTMDRHGEESLTMKAKWVDPALSRVV